ncbi:hypothetical protein PS918_02687 [Pseudomonas fluorescens]|uniref:ATPase AAA-type core domain-containing protein n=1 Tax=Pseudomonas fluorescens TaxID=294 RepID=A0A5E7SG03_PSEFL|nr:AAA family ATPase [Pseudomonas fluorescens]VVP85004.1 hypothetical protein PS918_02687 [Pseudomonas fluorescens]
MDFLLIGRSDRTPSEGRNIAYLGVDNWNDYSYVTMFYVTLCDENGARHDLGNVKIGFVGQTTSQSTHSMLPRRFDTLPEGFFSLGTDVDYYKKLAKDISPETCNSFLSGLRDVVANTSRLEQATSEDVFGTSLLRGVSISTIKEQFTRVLHGGVVRTNFSFLYRRLPAERVAGVELSFEVESDSKPSTNIHSIIGRNGVGKTTILNGMVQAVTGGLPEGEGFFVTNGWAGMQTPISAEYFSSLISVSFSAFDPFEPPPEQPDPSLGTCYYYIGLKTPSSSNSDLKSLRQLQAEYISALGLCMSDPRKKGRWHKAITALESDENFADMSLPSLLELSGADAQSTAAVLMSRMSSGHAVVLLTITKLVAMVEEKTLVLLDEPESHLHPPLLSAFLRALSELLYDRNGVAIIATHSPVVLQEIPTLCAWKINRSRLVLDAKRPEIQTFGENVGVLTREVFGLEVRKSGFHSLLDASVQNGGTFDQIMSEFSYQLGFEAQAILRAMVAYRDSRSGN